jgi:hypothetical protein
LSENTAWQDFGAIFLLSEQNFCRNTRVFQENFSKHSGKSARKTAAMNLPDKA